MKQSEKIKKQVVDHLYWDNRVDASNVKVDIDENKVTLEGEVPSYSARQAAVLDAWTVKGVSKVKNDLEVKYPIKLDIPTDDEIKSRIKSKLFWSPTVESPEIDVSVSAGIVTMEGSTDAYWKKLRAENLASDITGVVDIRNKIAVVPSKSYVDKDIANDIVSAIDRTYGINADDVDVKVKNGKVTLHGKAPNWITYNSVTKAAENTFGVIDVENHMIIK